MLSIHRLLLAIIVLPALAGPVFAHPGDHGAGGLLAGALHPLLGWDHLLAIVAVALWAARQPAGGATAVALVWLSGMAAGVLLAFEFAIPAVLSGGPAVTMLLTGLLLAGALRLPLILMLPAVALFAFLHGIAHAGSVPAAVSPSLYLAGMLAATTGLQGLAMAAGVRAGERPVRAAGVGLSAAGSWLLLAG